MFSVFNQDITFGDKVISLETGFMANQADGSVVAKCGGTTVLCVVCTAKEDSPDVDFFPLTVNYLERQYAGGKIPGGFFKREGKQSEREILISRLIDRPIRPIFVDGYYRNTQIICTLLSYDGETEPDMVALIGASTAVALAGLPTQGIASGCRIGYIDGKYVINPTKEELKESKLDLVVAGTTDAILMVESEAKILTEDEMLNALACGQEVINSSVEQIKSFVKRVNKEPAVVFYPRNREVLYSKMKSIAYNSVANAFKIQNKQQRHKTLDEIYSQLKELFLNKDCCEVECCNCDVNCNCQCCNECCNDNTQNKTNLANECNCCKPLVFQNNEPVEINEVDIKLSYARLEEEIVRGQIMREKIRIDGRKLDEVRPIEVRVGVLPVVHGSAVFSRGLTQSLAVATLGTSADEQQPDSLTDGKNSQRFILHYNFPGYSAGEATPPKAPGRRELGHGNLARRALSPVIPSQEEFPYTIRVVSEITSSDGSTSQATVCSCCMAMMDMGVPLKAPVAGVAMGLIKEGNEYEVLTDIMADEDHLGDMDFKVAGPKEGITALQMDIKTFGITLEIMKDALERAKKARIYIMSKMLEVLPAPRNEINENAPKMYSMFVDEKKIPDIIGKSGANIKKICDTTGAKIDILPEGKVSILADNMEKLAIAKEMIEASIGQIEFGRIFTATIKSVLAFGAIVDIGFDRSGLVHISELTEDCLEPSLVVSEGMIVKVKYIGLDEKGRFKFSMKQVNQQTGEDIYANNNVSFNNDDNGYNDNLYKEKHQKAEREHIRQHNRESYRNTKNRRNSDEYRENNRKVYNNFSSEKKERKFSKPPRKIGSKKSLLSVIFGKNKRK